MSSHLWVGCPFDTAFRGRAKLIKSECYTSLARDYIDKPGIKDNRTKEVAFSLRCAAIDPLSFR